MMFVSKFVKIHPLAQTLMGNRYTDGKMGMMVP